VGRDGDDQRPVAAIQGRQRLADEGECGAFRLVNAESDGLPGLVVDRYGHYLVLQFLTLGIEKFRDQVVELLMELLEPAGIYDRSDVDVRKREGVPLKAGPLAGEVPPDRLEIEEYGHRFLVDIKHGQKTGFYLDQRENRRRAVPYFQGAERALNAFSYTGGFGVYAAGAGVKSVVSVDARGRVHPWRCISSPP
jgi:23S rRNA (cytosine1962-C5)-methyltransferase